LRLRRPAKEAGAGSIHNKAACAAYATLFTIRQEALREGRGAQLTVGVGLEHGLTGLARRRRGGGEVAARWRRARSRRAPAAPARAVQPVRWLLGDASFDLAEESACGEE
jgi:hypothetical protein